MIAELVNHGLATLTAEKVRAGAALIEADDVERILANINAHRGNGRD